MKVVSPYEELKSWFSLENYEQLKSLTIKELYTELAFREAIFDSVNFGWEDDNQNLRSILEGNPILSSKIIIIMVILTRAKDMLRRLALVI